MGQWCSANGMPEQVTYFFQIITAHRKQEIWKTLGNLPKNNEKCVYIWNLPPAQGEF